MSLDILKDIIGEFAAKKFSKFFRDKNSSFKPRQKELDQYDDKFFTNGLKLGEIDFEDEGQNLIVSVFKSVNSLTEKSGKKAQYDKGKKILKELEFDAGIFIFYDQKGNFRFSLIYANYLGKKRDWSVFRRFTYFVSRDPDITNKTFLKQIGEGDFGSLGKVKEAFSVEKVTKEFYKDIANWYFWAVQKTEFPKDAEKDKNGRHHIAVIRLITRLIFIWFMRERGLVLKDLFQHKKINEYLKDLSPDKSTYYKAILQNLFFATLSTKRKDRKFGSEQRFKKGLNKDYDNSYVCRYHELFKNSDKIKDYFGDIPFLNGGLFECLDDKRKGIIVDGFSRTKKNQPVVPNDLFFSDEQDVDLNGEYGTNKKKYKARGLIDILSSYNFTIDENDPNDAEVALDPELLGKVFENLLASFNPETSSTARKATGSYYTPREIVDYMVTQSLKEYFKTHLIVPCHSDKSNCCHSDRSEDRSMRSSGVEESLGEKIDLLFKNEDSQSPFTETVSKKIVALIDNLRIVDPAVGSGAFPMGILNKLVFLLSKLDPENKFWKQTQLNAAKNIPDPKSQRDAIENIERNFTEKNVDYFRKLYLIQKCIYGVDLQQIAVEIAKLRFFIALLVDEKIDKEKENWGIEPLPNLDFKIMQGNSLISEFMGINFDEEEVEKKENEMFSEHEEVEGLINEFQQKKNEFQNEPDKDKKVKLKQEIDDLMIEIFETKLKKQRAGHFSKLESIKKNPFLIGLSKEKRKEIISKEKKALSKKEGFDLDKFESQLREFSGKNKVKPFFAWKLYFAEVFSGDNPGFDIVIANPPYLKERDNKSVFELVNDSVFGKKYHQGKMDFWYYFLHRAIDIVKNDGVISYITSRYWLNSSGAKRLIKQVAEELSFINFVDIGKLKVFDSVAGQHMVAIYKKTKIISDFVYKKLENDISDINKNKNTSNLTIKKLKNSLIFTDNFEIILDSCYKNLLNTIPLVKISNISQGVVEATDKVSNKQISKNKTNGIYAGDGVFVLNEFELKKEKLNNTEKTIIKKYLDPNDIFKYGLNWSKKYLIYSDKYIKEKINNGIDFINIKKHLDKYRNFITSSNKPYGLHRARDLMYFINPKIIFKGMFVKNEFTYDEDGYFVGFSFSLIVQKDQQYNLKYILAILNSKFALDWFYKNGKKRGAGVDIGVEKLRLFPIKISNKEQQKPFINLVDQILKKKKDNPQADTGDLEKRIDEMVYELYGLTEEEIKVVEKH
ncbi:Eco57I restriction-modification methylase domain-containing protein [Patescibacteria group bacterium]